MADGSPWARAVCVGVLVGLPPWVGLALLLCRPTLQLRADYLAIVTVAAVVILRLITRSPSMTDFSGGTQDLTGYGGGFRQLSPFDNGRFYDFYGIRFLGQDLWSICVGWPVLGLSLTLVFLLVRIPLGPWPKATREREDAVRAVGWKVFGHKVQALVLGGAVGARAGGPRCPRSARGCLRPAPTVSAPPTTRRSPWAGPAAAGGTARSSPSSSPVHRLSRLTSR